MDAMLEQLQKFTLENIFPFASNLIVALAIAGLLGFAVGWLAPRARRGHERE